MSGRAGRVRSGRVLRLYSRQQFSAAAPVQRSHDRSSLSEAGSQALPPQPSPEMQRCDLAQSCLQARRVNLGGGGGVYAIHAHLPKRFVWKHAEPEMTCKLKGPFCTTELAIRQFQQQGHMK